MPLYKKPGSSIWSYTFYFQGKRYRASTGEKTKAAAQTVEADALTRLSQGHPSPQKKKMPTLAAFSERFLLWSGNSTNLKPNSDRYYRFGWRLLERTELASMYLDHITREVIECTAFTRPAFDRRTRELTGEILPCSPAYANQALRTLKAMLGKAIEWDVLHKRPKINPPAAAGRDRLIDRDAEAALYKALHQPNTNKRVQRDRDQAWLVLCILQDTGMRPDEVFPMRIEDVHWKEDRIWIPSGKTPNARRYVGISDRMKALLTAQCEGRVCGWVLPSPRAASGHLESIAGVFSSARKGAGLDPRIVPYSARHTYGTYALAATGNVFAVSKSMGHAGIRSMVPYQHPDLTSVNEAINQRNRDNEEARLLQLTTESETVGHHFGQSTSMIQ